jgi:hypothetical protein
MAFALISRSQNIDSAFLINPLSHHLNRTEVTHQHMLTRSGSVFIPAWREYYIYNDDAFDFTSKNTYSYQNSNQLAQDLTENYIEGQGLFDYERVTYQSYGDTSIVIKEVSENGVWIPSQRDTTVINQYGHFTYFSENYFINGNLSFVSYSIYENVYDSDGKLLSTTLFSGNGPQTQFEYIYNVLGEITEIYGSNYNSLTQEWENTTRQIIAEWHNQEL